MTKKLIVKGVLVSRANEVAVGYEIVRFDSEERATVTEQYALFVKPDHVPQVVDREWVLTMCRQHYASHLELVRRTTEVSALAEAGDLGCELVP